MRYIIPILIILFLHEGCSLEKRVNHQIKRYQYHLAKINKLPEQKKEFLIKNIKIHKEQIDESGNYYSVIILRSLKKDKRLIKSKSPKYNLDSLIDSLESK